MDEKVAFDELDESLRRSGASWDAAQTHGLLTGRLAILGAAGGQDWLRQVMEEVDPNNALWTECRQRLDALYQSTFWQLSERLSELTPLLPPDSDSVHDRTEALSHWSEGFLHGLVSSVNDTALQEKLGKEPLADIIRDVLQITRAGIDGDVDAEENENAYAELVEYLRVAAQLCYEELAEWRHRSGQDAGQTDTEQDKDEQ